MGGVGAVASEQGGPAGPGPAEGADAACRVGADRVLEQERSRRLAVDRDEHGERTVQVRASTNLAHPRGMGVADDPPGFVGLEMDIDRNDDPTEAADRVRGEEELGRVRDQHADAITAPDAHPMQRVG